MSIAARSMRVINTSASVGYWGPTTSTIDWCENNYEISYYIAEFWNTTSNALFVVLGLYGLYRSIQMKFEPRFHLQFLGVMITGFGSAMFHGTLQHVYQQCDETPMVWSILVWNYIVYTDEIQKIPLKNAESYVIAFLTLIGAVFTVLHAIFRFTTAFQVFFGVFAISACLRLCVHYTNIKDSRARAVAQSYVAFGLIGLVFWLMDYHYCQVVRNLPVNPQGHAWWHIFMGVSSYHGPIFMQYVRMEQLKRNARIQEICFGIETIVVDPVSPAKTKKL
ncbi:alkaline phytoceramidase [Plasmopara halstedii]|uniref:Alkaline phytoceramidase n=1 Tax=Plasmopara halstedii TaxID=4781 RepID=A0A0P1AJK7_PLAHL|nr:alkaline phytoceramidase [Plasmopara halstedii]CEG40964.1 alkaline phytoceramidase [Plasmopara halstedii]|eukprot:XP_024577333.1 alkaline phytoceramidase [Plasmopara halstedii]